MTESKTPPEGWDELLLEVVRFGAHCGEWDFNDIPPARQLRRFMKAIFFLKNYGPAEPNPTVQWVLSLQHTSLIRALRMARGDVPVNFELLQQSEVPMMYHLAKIAERLNVGITRNNVHTIEKPAVVSWDRPDTQLSRLGWVLPDEPLRVEWKFDAKEYMGLWPVDEQIAEAAESIKQAVEEWDGDDFSRRLYDKLGINGPTDGLLTKGEPCWCRGENDLHEHGAWGCLGHNPKES